MRLLRDAVDGAFLVALLFAAGATYAIARTGSRVDDALFGADGWLTR